MQSLLDHLHLPRAALPALVTDQAAGEGLAAGLATNELSADVLSNERNCVAMVKHGYQVLHPVQYGEYFHKIQILHGFF